MSVYKRGSVWWVKIHIPGRSEPVRQSAGRGSTKAEARQLETRLRAKYLEDARRARHGQRPKRTFAQALLRWLEGEAKSLKSYKDILRHTRQVKPYIHGIGLEQAPEAAEDMKQAMLAEGLKPATINQRLAIIRRVLNLCGQWGWADDGLGKRVRLLSPKNERHVYLTPEQVDTLADASGDAAPVVRFLAYTGLRLGEFYDLSPDHIRDGCVWLPPTKGRKARVIPVPEWLPIPVPSPVTRSQFRRLFEQAREAAGMPHVRRHDLRHTYASLLTQSGASPTVVRDLMGHSHLGVTSRYAHLATSHLWDAVKGLQAQKQAQSSGEDDANSA